MTTSIQTTANLGGTASHVKIGKVALGLMMMTWTPNPVPDETCFEAIKAGCDELPAGTKMFINGGEFYSMDAGPMNLEMISRFFEKYPEYTDKTFLSVKGGSKFKEYAPDSSPENLRRSVTAINAALRGKKRLDLFECARVDHNVPIEDTIRSLKALIDEGLFDHIGVSECSAETLRKANSVHPITAVEIEVSPWSVEDETKKVLATAKELDVAVIAYAPLGREGDMRRHFTRFNKEDYFKHNLALVNALQKIAEKKGVPVASLAIAWVAGLGDKVVPLPGSSKAARVIENTRAADIKLTEDENRQVWDIINSHEVKGDRYYGADPKAMHLWG